MEINNKLLLENSKNLSVLYVEDDEILRESTYTMLLNFFKAIEYAVDGVEGLSKYKESSYDLVISDINMPNMNGIEMSKNIKDINPEQAIVFITAFNEIEYLKASIELGINGFLAKPIEIKNLKQVLYTVTQIITDRKLVQSHYEQIEELNMRSIDQKDARSFTSAKDILKDLEEQQEKISQLWMQREVVQERLNSHFIDVEFFRSHYGVKVLDYFLNVIRGDKEMGNCPVIFIMLDFFKNKNLPLKDIFMICVSFKNTLSSYIFKKYSFNSELFEDISVILDSNFEGVIINYLELKYTEQVSKPSNIKVLKPTKEEKAEVEDLNYAEYVLENDIYELQDLEEDIDTIAIAITESANSQVEDFFTLGDNIKRYGVVLSNYPIFSKLGAYVIKLGVNFSENAQLLYDDKERMLNIASLIEGFVNDLIIWRREIFDNNIEDPHFLDQSFFSNVDTIIMFIEYDESEVVEEDFDDMFF